MKDPVVDYTHVYHPARLVEGDPIEMHFVVGVGSFVYSVGAHDNIDGERSCLLKVRHCYQNCEHDGDGVWNDYRLLDFAELEDDEALKLIRLYREDEDFDPSDYVDVW